MSRVPDRPAGWRESQHVKDARVMLRDLYSPLWPGLTEDDWARTLRGVLAERDFLGDWLQRCLNESAEALEQAEADTERKVSADVRGRIMDCRLALQRLTAAVETENFNRVGNAGMSTNLRAALKLARQVLGGEPPC